MNDQEWLNTFCKGGYRGTKEVVERLEAEVERLRGALASIGAEAKLARDALLDERIVEARSCLNRIRELCDQDALEGGEK